MIDYFVGQGRNSDAAALELWCVMFVPTPEVRALPSRGALIGAVIIHLYILTASAEAQQCQPTGANQTCTNSLVLSGTTTGILDTGVPNITNAVSGVIEGSYYSGGFGGGSGVASIGAANVTNLGSISGAVYGINSGIGDYSGNSRTTITNYGTITNAGTAGTAAIVLYDFGTVTNYGRISTTGNQTQAIQFQSQNTTQSEVVINYGTILSDIANVGTNGLVSVTNYGTISGSPDNAIQGLPVNVLNYGVINGGIASNTGKSLVANYGLIQGHIAGKDGISLINYGQIINSLDADILEGFGGNNTIDNYGLMAGSIALDQPPFRGVNSITNHAGGTLNSGARISLGLSNSLINAGNLSPGGPGIIETTSLIGDLLNTETGKYLIDIDQNGQSDLLIVSGLVTLRGGTVQVLAQGGTYVPGMSYLIIDKRSAGPVSGTFASATTNLAFLTPNIIYDGGDGNDVVLTLLRTLSSGANAFLSFCSVTQTRNECRVASALDLFPDNALLLALLNQTAEGARQAFDTLSGEVHATVAGLLADDSRYVREAILGRLMQASATKSNGHVASLGNSGLQVALMDSQSMALGNDDKASHNIPPAYSSGPIFWVHAFGAWGNFDGNGDAAAANRNLGGFVSGMDARAVGSWRVGLAAGYSQSNLDIDARHSSADVESFHLGGYGGGMAGPFALRGGGTWTWNDIDTSRAVVFPGFYEREKASYDAGTGQLFGEVAHPTTVWGMGIEPFAGLAYVSIDGENFHERGGNRAALNGRGTDENVGYSTVGFRAASTMHWESILVTPHVSAAWQHAFDDISPDATLTFTSTGIGFTVYGMPLAENTALIDAGLDLALSPNTEAGVSYSGQFGEGVQDDAVRGRLTLLF